MPTNNGSNVTSAFLIAMTGLIIPAVLVVFLVIWGWKANEISIIIGLFTGVVGTMVGAFLGVQVGAAGKARLQDIAHRALAALPPAEAKQIVDR